jgi:hypothetical protein
MSSKESDISQGTRTSEDDISLPVLVEEAMRNMRQGTDYSPSSFYQRDPEEEIRALEERQQILKCEEATKENLWRIRTLEEAVKKYGKHIKVQDLEIVMHESQVFWSLNENPKVKVRLKNPTETQRRLFRECTQKGEQGEFYWVYVEER